jgi:hypothetical protein
MYISNAQDEAPIKLVVEVIDQEHLTLYALPTTKNSQKGKIHPDLLLRIGLPICCIIRLNPMHFRT